MSKLKILSDEEIGLAMKRGYEEAQPDGNDDMPLPAKAVAQTQFEADKKVMEQMIEGLEAGAATPNCKCGCWAAFKKKWLG